MVATSETEIIGKIKKMDWRPWMHRQFSPFVTHLMMWAATKEAFLSEGIDGEYPIALYDTNDWYCTPDMFALSAAASKKYLQETDIFTLTKQCEDKLTDGRAKILALVADEAGDPVGQFRTVVSAIKPINIYVWVAHSAEAFYSPLIHTAVAEHFPASQVETIVGDISYPTKKNFAAQMEDDIRAGMSTANLHQKYACIKARGGFKPGYSMEEISNIQKEVLEKPAHIHVAPDLPSGMAKLVREVQEMVYLRTLRTDALWELYYLAQPVFNRYARAVKIESVKDYTCDDLLAENYKKWPREFCAIKYYEDVVITNSIISESAHQTQKSVKGVVAKSGRARGVVKIVLAPSEIGKVEIGDILVTNMTTPAYISAMQKAAAFVTDEGGITCHAAILAREMDKPCVIGTKIATKIFKDGDRVEVDANSGVVKLL